MAIDKCQGGADYNLRPYYNKVLRFFPAEPVKLLNIGSGVTFVFENYLHESRADNRDVIDCLDIMETNSKPEYIRSFYTKSVEEPFFLSEPYDYICAFEVVEHIDNTEMLVKNAFNNLREGGVLLITHPNLSSLQSRIELLLGFQPHIIEMCNESAWYGGGVFAKKNNPSNNTIHHIRGITYRAMREMLEANGFKVECVFGSDGVFKFLSDTRYASLVGYVCKK